MMKAELKKAWSCGVCDELCNSEFRAENHCEVAVGEWLICSLCPDEQWENTARGSKEAEAHLRTHTIGPDGLFPEEAYAETLLFGNKPVLGEWAVTMNAETEFLIPND